MPRPAARPTARAMTFLIAPPSSQPATSVPVGRKYGVRHTLCSAVRGRLVGAGDHETAAGAVRRRSRGPGSARTALRSCSNGMPEDLVRSPPTSAARSAVSMPFIELATRTASGSMCGAQAARFSRNVCAGIDSTTWRGAPASALTGSVVARRPVGQDDIGQVPGVLVLRTLIVGDDLGRRLAWIGDGRCRRRRTPLPSSSPTTQRRAPQPEPPDTPSTLRALTPVTLSATVRPPRRHCQGLARRQPGQDPLGLPQHPRRLPAAFTPVCRSPSRLSTTTPDSTPATEGEHIEPGRSVRCAAHSPPLRPGPGPTRFHSSGRPRTSAPMGAPLTDGRGVPRARGTPRARPAAGRAGLTCGCASHCGCRC